MPLEVCHLMYEDLFVLDHFTTPGAEDLAGQKPIENC